MDTQKSPYGHPQGQMVNGVWKTFSQMPKVRGVVTANIASLAAFTVVSNDGLTYAEGETVLLAGQTTAAQCGPYVVGVVSGTTAPLTRSEEYAGPIDAGMVLEVSEGTLWAGSSWKAMCVTGKVWGTDDPLFYPMTIHRTVTLVAGTMTMGAGGDAVATPIFSATKTSVAITRNTANTSTGTTGGYAAITRTAGKAGTGAVVIQAQVAAGTISASDISTLDVTITNA